MDPIEINLMPWREVRNARRRTIFYASMAVVATHAGSSVFGLKWHYGQQVAAQEERVEYLEGAVATMSDRIQEISEVEATLDSLEQQVAVFSALQEGRTQAVHVINGIVTSLEDGVYYDSIRREGGEVHLRGFASSNQQVSNQIRKLSAEPSLTNPDFSEVESVEGDADQALRVFRLSVEEQPAGKVGSTLAADLEEGDGTQG